MKIRLVILGLVSVLSIGLTACKSNNNSQPVTGGVDGSGGDLSYIVDESFQDWVTNDHHFYVRDLIHRLFLIQKNSPQDFGTQPKLASDFLSIGEDELQKLAASIRYQVVPSYCSSSNHGSSDAAVTPDGKICFSYLAFKNLGLQTFIPKLLSLTMHELAHLRNFSEADAQTWQLLFERGRLGKKTILSFNEDYRITRKMLSNIISDAVVFGEYIISTSESLNKSACVKLGGVQARVSDILFYYQNLPSYLRDELDREIITPFYGISCESDSKVMMMSKLEKILAGVNKIEQKIENFENPLCTGELCAFSRRRSKNDPKVFLAEWESKKQKFFSGTAYEKNRVSDVNCTLTNTNTGAVQKFETNADNSEETYTSHDLSKIDNELSSLVIQPTHIYEDRELNEKQYTSISIEVMHGGPMNILESKGFASDRLWLNGVLVQKGDVTKVKFAIMDSGKNSVPSEVGPNPLGDVPYYLSDATIQSFYLAPKLLRSYELECRLN